MNQGVTKFPLTVEKVFTIRLIRNKFEKGDIIRSINGVQIYKNLNVLIIYLKIVDLMKNLLILLKEMDRL